MAPRKTPKNTVVLDIDCTLVNTIEDEHFEFYKSLNLGNSKNISLRDRVYCASIDDATKNPGAGKKYELSGVFRPYLDEFLEFLFDNFNVIVWSAGKDRYVHTMCDILFPHYSRQPQIIYTACESIIKSNGFTIKPLSMLYNDKINASNIFIIDDTPSTYSRNPDNAIRIPKFLCHVSDIKKISNEDNHLLVLKNFLEKNMVNCNDVRNVKKNVFTFKNDNE